MPNYKENRPGAGVSSQEQAGPHHKTHEELVADFRAVIKKRKDLSISPEELLHHELVNMRHSSLLGDEKPKFFERLEEAWEVLISDRLPHGSAIKRKVDGGLALSYNTYRKIGVDNAPQSILDCRFAHSMPWPRLLA